MSAMWEDDFKKSLLEKKEAAWSGFQDANDQIDKQMMTRAQPETRLVKSLQMLDSRMDAIDMMLRASRRNRPNTVDTELMRDFTVYLRKGVASPALHKTMTEGDNTQGGYLAPVEYVREIIRSLVDYSPIRQLARVITIQGSSAWIPRRTSPAVASWLGLEIPASEIADSTGLGFGLEQVPAHYNVTRFTLSNQLANDPFFDIAAEVREEIATASGVLEGAAFIGGDGVKKPEGILTHSGITSVASGNTSTLTADGVINLCYALSDRYARSASWLMRRATIRDVRRMKDGDGYYLWQPGLLVDMPDILMGRPVVQCPDMPAIGAGTYPIAFGDIYRGYRVVDSLAGSIIRDDNSRAAYMEIVYIGALAVGGQVVDPNAIVKQVVAAS